MVEVLSLCRNDENCNIALLSSILLLYGWKDHRNIFASYRHTVTIA